MVNGEWRIAKERTAGGIARQLCQRIKRKKNSFEFPCIHAGKTKK